VFFSPRVICATVLLVFILAPIVFSQNRKLEQAIDRYTKQRGPITDKPKPLMADLNGDAVEEAVVSYCVDDNQPGGANAGASNPANVHCHVVVFGLKDAQWVEMGQQDLGQGDVKGVRNGMILAQSVTYAPKDPLCCPSRQKSLRLGLRNGKLLIIGPAAAKR
jgi:hypothetical protein